MGGGARCPASGRAEPISVRCHAVPSKEDLAELRAVARLAALRGAAVVRDATFETEAAAMRGKGLPGDWVTEVDVASERAISELLRAHASDIPIQGEETGGATEGLRWIVDPLDGTTNFVHGFPAVGVSVALVDHRSPVAGAIASPYLGDVWHAARGEGATWEPGAAYPSREARPCRVSDRDPDRAVVATGFPFRHKERVPRYVATMTAALERFEDLRRPGAASLDLAWVACGVFDGFFELGLGIWDVAAGGLLIEEGGGAVTDWTGGPEWLGGDILAGPPAVHAELLDAAGAR
jgi:myo-inositol-1(or 4)-monophosphatase